MDINKFIFFCYPLEVKDWRCTLVITALGPQKDLPILQFRNLNLFFCVVSVLGKRRPSLKEEKNSLNVTPTPKYENVEHQTCFLVINDCSLQLIRAEKDKKINRFNGVIFFGSGDAHHHGENVYLTQGITGMIC